MAILIPSKNIYNKNNEKIRDNIIDYVKVGVQNSSPNNELNVSVFQKSIYSFEESEWIKDYKLNGNWTESAQTNYRHNLAIAGIRTYNVKNYLIEFSKFKNQNYISKAYWGNNEDNKPNITTNIIYNEKTGILPFSIKHTEAPYITTSSKPSEILPTSESNMELYLGGIEYTTNERKQTNAINENDISINLTIDEVTTATNTKYIKINGDNLTNIATTEITGKNIYDDNQNIIDVVYQLNVSILCGFEKYIYEGNDGTADSGMTVIDFLNSTHNYGASVIKYEPLQVEVNINGDIIGINLVNDTITYGNGKTPFSLEGNELLQLGNTITNQKATEYLANLVLDQYKNGKETATLVCSIDDYFEFDENSTDYKGSKRISISGEKDSYGNKFPMFFEIGDEVVPMLYGANGKDFYMSKHNDETPKTFKVVKNKIYGKGIIRQELVVQEI